jgi:hypothetical protein
VHVLSIKEKKMKDTSKFRPRLLGLQAALVLLFMAAANLYAEPMSISLNGASEVPPVTTSAEGTGQITVLSDHTVSGSIKISGFEPTMAHIHEAAVGQSGPPIITLSKTGDDSFAVPPGAKLTDAQYTSYLYGKLYVNVHSAQHPNGEIRAQLMSTEPSTTPMRPGY